VKDIHSQQIKVAGLDIHYLTGGRGAPLVVVHGGSEGARAWRENMEALSENYTVYVPDLPGFGHSQSIKGSYYIPELVEFVDRFSRSLGLQSFHLMGHSLGGGVALSYALKFPYKVTRLVLVNSLCLGREIALWVRVLSLPAVCRTIGAVVLSVLKGVKWVAGKLLVPVELVAPFSRTSLHLGISATTLREQTTVLRHRLSEVVAPTLVVWGGRDPIVPARQAYAAAALIPDCRVKVFEDSGHSVYREKLAEFSRLLTEFLG